MTPWRDQIRREIARRGLGVREVAREVGMPAATLSRYLSEDAEMGRDLTGERLQKLAEYLGFWLEKKSKKLSKSDRECVDNR